MKKLLLLLTVLLLAGPAYLLTTGTISVSSLSMLLNVMTGRGVETPQDDVIEQRFILPEGFAINLYAGDLPKARFLRFTDGGDLLVSRPHAGDIVLIHQNPDSPAVAGEQVTLLSGLTRPSGIDLADGWLYVGESNAVGRIRFDAQSGTVTGDYQHIISDLTDDGNHAYKAIRIGPDQKLYLSQGSTCNVCVEQDPRRATMSRFNLDGSAKEIIATGLRNSLGFDWAPWDGALYATDNGRDMLGDDYPPCELNKIEAGNFYGWPYYNGANEPDPDFTDPPAALAKNPIAPVHEFRAHNAPLGMSFVNTQSWPATYDKVALAALHGSWNRSSADGYKVVSLHWENGQIKRRDFLSGFEKDGNIIGRPVDVAQGPDGAIYISDDYAGAIYRVSYGEGQASVVALPGSSKTTFKLQQPDWLTGLNTAQYMAQGKALYGEHNCVSCHDPKTAVGNIALHNVNQRLQYNELIERLSMPTAPMPLFPLDLEDQRAVAVYLLSGEETPK
ncbi:MAG: PQQ-dependent sugar dehydrogenase [Halioglobus sp.]